MLNRRYTVALHVLCLLAHQRGEPLTSEFIAGSVNTNAVVIRQVLGLLRRAGLVTSRRGVSGGWRLAQRPSSITLARVYEVVRPGSVFAMHSRQPNPRCPVGRGVQRGLLGHYQRAQAAMEAELARVTVEDVLDDVLGKED